MSFEIQWTVEPDGWNAARRRVAEERNEPYTDEKIYAFDDLLPGWIRFYQNGSPAIPQRTELAEMIQNQLNIQHEYLAEETSLYLGYGLWVAEFWWYMAYFLDEGEFDLAPLGTDAKYYMFSEALTIRFYKTLNDILILTEERVDLGWSLVIPNVDFFKGMRAFIQSFALELRRNVPELLARVPFPSIRTLATAVDQ